MWLCGIVREKREEKRGLEEVDDDVAVEKKRKNRANAIFPSFGETTDLADQVACCRILHKVGAATVVARLLEAEPGRVPRRGEGGGHLLFLGLSSRLSRGFAGRDYSTPPSPLCANAVRWRRERAVSAVVARCWAEGGESECFSPERFFALVFLLAAASSSLGR